MDNHVLKRVVTKNAEETEQFGQAFATLLKDGDVVAFFGELGSGKTTMIRGVCRGFGVGKGVKSPSFVYMRIYKAATTIYHFDFYRLRAKEELVNIDLSEYFCNKGLVLLEWADRVAELLPASRYDVGLTLLSENEREIVVTYTNKGSRE